MKKITPRVMLVDDDKVMLIAMEEALKESGYETSTYESAESALEVIEQSLAANGDQPPCDLLVSDINMPGISGLEFCQKISQKAEFKYVPVMLVSGQTDEQTIVEGYKSGCFDFIPKPLLLDKFLAKCDNATKQMQKLFISDQRASKAKAIACEAMEAGNRLTSIIEFSESGKTLDSFEKLAKKVFKTLERYGYQSSILFECSHGEPQFFSNNGYENPLEKELLIQLRKSDNVFESTHYYEFNGRLFSSFDKSILLIRNATQFSEEGLKDYIGALMNCVDTRAKIIEHEETRLEERQVEKLHVIEKFEESIVELKGIFQSQMHSLNSIIELMVSELHVRFSSLDIGERNEQMIQEMAVDHPQIYSLL